MLSEIPSLSFARISSREERVGSIATVLMKLYSIICTRSSALSRESLAPQMARASFTTGTAEPSGKYLLSGCALGKANSPCWETTVCKFESSKVLCSQI